MSIKDVNVQGERYQAEVPDTLDLAERARLSVNALTCGLCPETDYMPGPGPSEFFCAVKNSVALPMMRLMSGSDLNLDREKALMESHLSFVADDGLLYCPANNPQRKAGGNRGYPPTDEDYAHVSGSALLMLAMMSWYDRDNDAAWLSRIKKAAEGLAKVAIFKDDYAYYPDGGVVFDFSYLKRSGYKNTDEPQSEFLGAEGTVKFYQSYQIRALARWYAMSGDEQALTLAKKVKNFVLKPKLWEEGTVSHIVGAERAHWLGHFHGHITTFRSLLGYATVTNDLRLKEFVRAGYEYTRNFGIPRIGFSPNSNMGPHQVGHRGCESCQVAGLVGLAIQLCDAGLGDYWDDVDGMVRNQLVEQQFVNSDMIKAAQESNKSWQGDWSAWLGGFDGSGHLTALNVVGPTWCCTPNGAQALYHAWESIVRHRDGVAQVNLLLNRASPWLDLHSYLPYEGKVVIQNKTARKLAVRIPGWANRKTVQAQVNGKEACSFWVDNYLVFDGLREKDVVTIEFPLVEETVEYTVPGGKYVAESTDVPELPTTRYTCHFKGNTLVDVSPRNDPALYPCYKKALYPIYLRDHYKANRAPMKKVTRYIAPFTVKW